MDERTLRKLIWFAGFMDGEGSIGIRIDHKPERVHRPVYLVAQIQMSTTSKDSLDYILALLAEAGVRGAGYTYQEKDPAKHLDSYILRIQRLTDIALICPMMVEHAVTKRRQWELMHRYVMSRLDGATIDAHGRVHRGGNERGKTFTDEELAIAEELHVLNQRGAAAIAREAGWRQKLAMLKEERHGNPTERVS